MAESGPSAVTPGAPAAVAGSDRAHQTTTNSSLPPDAVVRDQGFTVLSEGDVPIVDLVFIHGVQGHPHNTWAAPSADLPKVKGSKIRSLLHRRPKQAGSDGCPTAAAESVFWPKDFLAADCKHARVLTYGYDSHVSHFFRGPANQNNISAHGRSLLNALELIRRESPRRPIVFIVHSLGGIVLKEALRRSRAARPEDQDLRDIYECTHAIVFFGTPHRGSSYAKIGLVAEQIVNAVGFDTNAELLRNLKPDGTHLEILREEFSAMLEERAFKVYSFQEGQGLKGANVLSRKVVDDASSSLDSQMERKDSINANHMMMCRFSSREDEGYIKLHGVVAKYVLEVGRAAEAKQQELDANQRKLQELILLSLRTAAMDDRQRQIESVHSHTFDWIFTDPEARFQSWTESDHGIFWIKGKPGSGKSTLMKYILNDPRTLQSLSSRGRDVLSTPAFFFHDRGEDTQKSFDGLLRSVLFQLVCDIPALTHTVAKFYYQQMERYDACSWPVSELERSLQAVLAQQRVRGCVCLFVDALDEFKGRKDEITRFLKALAAPEPGQRLTIRICASSREWNEFLMLSDNPHITLQDWTVGDIRSFARDRLAEAQREGTNLLLEEITKRAEGVFLWVKLVIDELWEPLSNGLPMDDLVTLMGDLPDELPLFYERMLSNIPQRYREMSLCMFELVLSPMSYNLTLSEFSLAVELMHPTSTLPQDVDLDSAEDRKRCDLVRRRVKACSGGLLEVTSKPRVQFIHQTAQSFVRDAESRVWFDGKSASDLAIAGAERIMRLIVQLIGHMDKTPRLFYFRDWASDQPLERPDGYPLFDSFLIHEFVFQAVGCQSISRLPSQAVIDEFRESMAEHCGPRWLETHWSTIDPLMHSLASAISEAGRLVPASFLEFLVWSRLLQVAEREITQNQSRGLTDAESTRLWYYVVAGNSRAAMKSEGTPHQVWSDVGNWLWRDFARMIAGRGCSPRGTVSLDIANDVGLLMAQLRSPHRAPFSPATTIASTRSLRSNSDAEGSSNENGDVHSDDRDSTDMEEHSEQEEGQQDGSIEEGNSAESGRKSSSSSSSSSGSGGSGVATSLFRGPDKAARDPEKRAAIVEDITPLHMALAFACTYDADYVLERVSNVDMVRILVESGADATAKYQNLWKEPRDHTERTAVHYLLYKDPGGQNPFDDRELGDALSKCIVSFFDHGLDPNAVDSDGKSILECAIPFCPASLIEMLLQRGAKITPGLLTETGELIPAASDILGKPKWRRPEFYTPEASRLVQLHNPAWAQDSPKGLVQAVRGFSVAAARTFAGLPASFWKF